MAFNLTAQEKAEIFKVTCSEKCLIHLQKYFETHYGLVDLERYRALYWEAIAEDGVVGMGPGKFRKWLSRNPELAELTNLEISLVARNVEWTLAQQQTQVA
ncbi:hypothetical protein DAPPUDRAFT_269150 [Daphnia pulex]|uniref:Uncharacterized protein n=1 Tax=Daphnia pulex TaxID=6669 RepID=E9HYX7_DAPPU|nr:hypothetical protein DAPPUDRAFT_269150 [Daphnia pulex]|eukprot:EFX63055.1 hypothetical protein DAPPUDRAFT_269150 [Daphnia pulex]